ncbi:MAG: hypothetical protein AB8F95_12505 [Bacteroidia bacterium]
MRSIFFFLLLLLASLAQAQQGGFSRLFMTTDSLDGKIIPKDVIYTGHDFVTFGEMFTRRDFKSGIWIKFDSSGKLVDTSFYASVDTFPYYTFYTSFKTILRRKDDSTTFLISKVRRTNNFASGDYQTGTVFSKINTNKLDTAWFRFVDIPPRDPTYPFYLVDAMILPDGSIAGLLTDDFHGRIIVLDQQGTLSHVISVGEGASGIFNSLTYKDSVFWVGGIRLLRNTTPNLRNAIIQKINWQGDLLSEYSTNDTIARLQILDLRIENNDYLSFGCTYFRKWLKPPFQHEVSATQPMMVQLDVRSGTFQSSVVDTLTPGLYIENVESQSNRNRFFVGGSTKIHIDRSRDYFGYLAKARQDGTVTWTRNYTTSWQTGSDTVCCKGFVFKGVEPLDDGGAVAVGNLSFFDNTQQNQLIQKKTIGWLIRVDSFGCVVPGCQHAPDGIAPALPKARLLIAPNPASDITYAHWLTEEPGEAVFSLRDAQGRLIRQWTSMQPEMTFVIPLQELASGMYYLDVLHHGRMLEGKKLVKL